jgi:hypothetical protein
MRSKLTTFLLLYACVLAQPLWPQFAAANPETPAVAKTQTPAPKNNAIVPGSRILKSFDFEERALGNFETIPMFWSKVAGNGYPAYSTGHFDNTTSRSAQNSFKLQIDGGSAAFQFTPGHLPINPSADYYLLAFVKTSQLKHAKARISAWFADEHNKIVPNLEFHSQPYSTPAPPNIAHNEPANDDWHILHLYIPGPGPTSPAKSLVLQLGLLQPQQLAPGSTPELGKFALYQQDIKGEAWFDDIVIFQLPRLSVSIPPTVNANTFAPNQKVELDLTVSDLASATDATAKPQLTANLKLTNPDGLLFASDQFTVTPSKNGEPWTHRYNRAALPPGLYTATLDVSDSAAGTLIARRQTRFVCLAPPFAVLDKPAPEFGYSIPSNADIWPQIPHLIRHTRAGLLQVPTWRSEMSEEALLRRDPSLDTLLTALHRLDVHAIATFSDVPTALGTRFAEARAKTPPAFISNTPSISVNSILGLSDADPTLWRPYVSFILARYANRFDAWEFGSQDTPYCGMLSNGDAPHKFTGADTRFPALYAKTTSELSILLNHPDLIVPWNALFEFDPKLYPGAGLDLRLPASIKPSQIPAYLDNFKQALAPPKDSKRPAPPMYVRVDSLNAQRYERADRLADFAQRIVYARSANPAAVIMDLPLSTNVAAGRSGHRAEPDELLVVYRTLILALGNSEYRREIPLAPGIRAFLFDRSGVGTLVVWNESAADSTVHIDLPLGAHPRAIDLAGNARLLPMDATTGTTGINITSTPMILDQLDTKSLQLRASFTIAAKTFPAGAGIVRTEILLTNPYSESLAGTLKISLPRGWTMEPPSIPMQLRPGETIRKPITIRYPYSELAGSNTINGYLLAENNQKYEFTTMILITSDVVELDSSMQLMPNGDLVVQQIITNISQTSLNAQAYAQVPGYPRQQRYLLELAPGQSSVKRFVFPMSTFDGATKDTKPADIAAALTGKTAAVGLKSNDGRTLITKSLPLQ